MTDLREGPYIADLESELMNYAQRLDAIENAPPLAWLIQVTTPTPHILGHHAYKDAETAQKAAARLSNRWRTCVAIPVIARP